MEDSRLMNVLRKLSIALGAILLIGSIHLSFDGFDQSVTGDNPDYTLLAMGLGYAIAITFSVLEFIVSSRNEELNTTLRFLGITAYAYSIYTNYLGLQHLLNMDKGMAALVAVFMDVVPEPMIAFGLGEAVVHDLLANLGKFASAPIGKSGKGGGGGNQNRQQNNQQHNQHKGNGGGGHFPSSKPGYQSHGGGGERRRQLEAQFGSNGKGAAREPNTQPRRFDDEELE